MPWRLRVAPSAERSLARLSEAVAAAIVEFVVGPLVDEPRRVGKPLERELAGHWSARRGSYRVLYRVDEQNNEVLVLRIEHRSDIYRPR